ncbi:MAG: pyruvate formate-lyase-activating protein [Defluviitaleaceae bacterium]|nr:pyruvate formate-lyase-activating protein [Defluviitaleaceae bacterium]
MLDMNKAGHVHSIDTCGMVDGPGIRYLLFLSGCPLRCKYCHNPDTWERTSGKIMTVGEILTDIKRYKSYMKFSGGGVTVSGGEPLAQAVFLEALLRACKDSGFHTAVDTSGYASRVNAGRVLAHTDLVLLDIKSINPETYKNLTGVPIDRTLRMLELCHKLGRKVWVRYVLVPGLTDDINDIQHLAEYLKPYDNIERIDVVPFHKVGEYKWQDLGLDYDLADTQPPSQELLELAISILSYQKPSSQP